jgi:glycyl-tRNA synthetase
MTPPSFQRVLLDLQEFWERQGCLIWQPYYTQVGAGTMNPATFLRVLGPEPWRVAYVEPSVRPADGRYGENPNRLGQYYQFQVILKPDPGNPQEIFLDSLAALGIPRAEHDVRFVEDNWEQPALGAWGLGWEVWLDGQEIAQFTYFQQAGGIPLEVPSVEITYGVERILMTLQKVSHFREIRWVDEVSYGDVLLQSEQEHSRYNFQTADVERLREAYGLFADEARAALAAGLVLPAHDYVLKCSHAFNVLDARGSIGVTERAHFFAEMRQLASQVARAYLDQRQALAFPLAGKFSTAPASSQPRERPARPRHAETAREGREPFLLEVGTEELPSADLDRALEQVGQIFRRRVLEAHRLAHRSLQVLGTPRRLVLHVEGLAVRTESRTDWVKGPTEGAAFDSQGKPTPALRGWARKNGVDEAALGPGLVHEIGGRRYVALEMTVEGESTADLLATLLPEILGEIRFDRTLRWNATGVSFSRPVRWLVALLGSRVIEFEFAGVKSGQRTRGLRRPGKEEIEIETVASYFEKMRAEGIELSVPARRQGIWDQIGALARQVGATIREDPGLLAEVANLVESPHALLGSFDRAYLGLPPEVLISVMKKHQRYFPLEKGGELQPYFVAVRNGDGEGMELVREGNEHVLQARFADAEYFIRQDRKQPLEQFLPRLGTLTFQARLGSMLEKSRRVEALVEQLIPWIGLEPGQAEAARRAAHLCKADLVTQMVVEMTSLQGVMGRYYALDSGERPETAQAIYEHYLPRSAEDEIPRSAAGVAVGLADRLDSLAGLFVVGLAPSGTSDPFALRRAAIGVVQILTARAISFDLRRGIDLAVGLQPIPASAEVPAAVFGFVVGRLRAFLSESGLRHDVVEAAVAGCGQDPHQAEQVARQLSEWIQKPDWPQILAAYARCVRISRDFKESFAVDPQRFAVPAEAELWTAVEHLEAQVGQGSAGPAGTMDRFLEAFVPLVPKISKFFEDVLVMTEEESLRQNRLGVLQHLSRLPRAWADLSFLEGF